MPKAVFVIWLSCIVVLSGAANASELSNAGVHQTLDYTFDGEVLCGQDAQSFLETIGQFYDGRREFNLNLRLLEHQEDFENDWLFFIDNCFDNNPEDCNAALCTGFEIVFRNENGETIAPLEQSDGSKLIDGRFVVEHLTGPRQGHMSIVLKLIPPS